MPQRPNVVVYQEYDALDVVPDIPDLDCLIVGPAYQLLDYLDDKSDIYAADYGSYQDNSPYPTTGYPLAVTIASLPSIKPGAVVDSSSVRVFFDEAQVSVYARDDTAAPTAFDGIYSLGSNLFVAHTTAGGAHFSANGVAVGDTLIVTSDESAAEDPKGDYIHTVKEVIETIHDYGGTLDFITNGVQPGDTVVISGDTNTNARNGTYSVLRVRDEETLEFVGTGWKGNFEGDVPNAATIDIKAPSGASRTGFPATLAFADYGEARTTADFIAAPPVATIFWRFERTISDEELDSTDFSVSGNTVTVNASITVDLSSTLLSKPVAYAKIYTEYKALRTDLQGLNEINSYADMQALLGKYDARNPLFVGAVVAKSNTTTPIYVYGVESDDLPGYLDFIERIDSKRDIYAIAPMTYNSSVIAALVQMAEQLADPNYALTNGTKQKFRVICGAIELPTTETLINAQSGGTTSAVVGTAPSPAVNSLGTIVATGSGTPPDLPNLAVVPGDVVELVEAAGPTTIATYTVATVRGTAVLTTDEVITASGGPYSGAGDYIQVRGPTPAGGSPPAPKGKWEVGVDSVTAVDITGAALTDLYLTLELTGATFLTGGVTPGDLLQIPEDPESSVWTTYDTWVIDEVLSETRLRVVNNGPSTSALANELPHLYKRTDGSAITAGLVYARVIRNLTKDEQVDAMVAVADSYSSMRLVLSYPDTVDVSDLTDGSKTRSGTSAETADSQPGYYLAAALAGQTAGEPPQQGFTNLGIAGIDKIYNSDNYFSERQLSELSNGGVNVYSQANDNALPLSIHSLTTDISSLQFSEYMIVKDFDFVAWTNLDALQEFIGTWNVSKETIEFIRQALVNTNNALKSRFVAKIGPPLQAYTITYVGESEISSDRIEAYVDVDLPVPVNTIALHLVA